MSVSIRDGEIRRVEDENQAAHVFMNVAAQRDEAGLVEYLGGRGIFVRRITPEVEPFCRGVRENVVIGVVEVREINFRPDLDREQSGTKSEVLLCDLLGP